MNREIKFRVKGTSGDCLWLYCDSIKKMWTGLDQIAGEVIDWETLSQFTGLKDKNGVEIYEGDLIKYQHSSYDLEKYSIAKVVWKNGGFVFIYNDILENVLSESWYAPMDVEITEVIGNIYENPELI